MAKKPIITWEYYSKRRGINLTLLLQKRNLFTKEDLLNWCLEEGIQGPPEGQILEALKLAYPPEPVIQPKKPKAATTKVTTPKEKKSAAPKKRTYTRRKTKQKQ